MIKDMKMRIATDERGVITSGEKNEAGQMVKFDYFDVGEFPELVSAYGKKPKKLILLFPTSEPLDFFDCQYQKWARGKGKEKGTLMRSCNGDECLHRVGETISGKTYQAGDESGCVCTAMEADDPLKCSQRMVLKAWVVNPQTGRIIHHLCYRFASGKNSSEALWGEIKKIQFLNQRGGGLLGVPFALSVDMVTSPKDVRMKFPVWTLRAVGTMEEIETRAQRYMLEGRVSLGGLLEAGNEERKELPPSEQAIGGSDLSGNNKSLVEGLKSSLAEVKTTAGIEEWLRQHQRELVVSGQLTEVELTLIRQAYAAKTKTLK